MRITVTGAAGFIGSHLCEALLAAGHQARGIDGFTPFYARELKERNVAALRRRHGFELVERNLLADRPLVPLLEGSEAVCHLAGRPGVRSGDRDRHEAGNVDTTEAVMRAAADAGVRRVLLASSSSVYGSAAGQVAEDAQLRPLSDYGRSKWRAEAVAASLAERLGLELVILRYFTVYGPRQRPDMAFARFISAALGGGPMDLLGDGRQVRDFTYVGDAVDATIAALERAPAGAVLNVSGGRPASLSGALALLAAELAASPPLTARAADAREPRATAADLGRIRRHVGWRPRVPLELGLALQAQPALALAS
jgi:UDP-glucuronate 4-epimerase